MLSAVSVLLAVIGLLYGVWYDEVLTAIRIEVPQHLADAKAEREQVTRALNTRALPLFLSSLILTFLLLPDALRILVDSVRAVLVSPVGAARAYVTEQAVFLAVFCFFAFFAWHTRRLVAQLKRKRTELEQ